MTYNEYQSRNPAPQNGSGKVATPPPPTAAGALPKRLPEPLAYDIKQAAAALNTCTKTVRRLVDRGLLTNCKAVRKILIPRKQIEEFIKATCNQPGRIA